MKNLVIALFGFAMVLPAHAADASTTKQRSATEGAYLQTLHEAPGLSREQIFERALIWVTKSFTDSNEVIRLNDPTSGKLVGKGVDGIKLVWGGLTPVGFTLVVDVKDGRYRTTFDEFEIAATGAKLKQSQIELAKTHFATVDQSLNAAITSEQNPDW